MVPRLAQPSDLSVITELIPRSVRALQAEFYSPEQMEGALGTVFAVDTQLIRDGTYFVSELEGRLLGCGGWSRRKTLFGGDVAKAGEDTELDPNKDAARVRAFFVDPDFARRGIGSAIMRRCEEAIVAAGFRRVTIVATLCGEPLYARFGYDVVRRFDVPLSNGQRLPVVEMSRQID